MEYRKIKDLKKLPNNPRTIKDDSFQKLCTSIATNKAYFEARPLILSNRTGELVVIAGNQRLEACKHLGYKEAPTYLLDSLTEEQEREIIIRDNVNNGEWDYEELKINWNAEELELWGVEVEDMEDEVIDSEEFGTDFNLPDGDKAPFQQMTFTLADEQAEQIKNAIADIKATEEYKYAETMGNENSNGNALYLIIMQWAEQRKY